MFKIVLVRLLIGLFLLSTVPSVSEGAGRDRMGEQSQRKGKGKKLRKGKKKKKRKKRRRRRRRAQAEEDETPTKGRAQIWGENCGHCHGIRPATEFSDVNWEIIIFHMRIHAGFTEAQAKAVREIMQSSN